MRCGAQAASARTCFFNRAPSRSFSISKSYRDWRFIQYRSERPKYIESRRTVSAVMARLPWTISLMRRGGTEMSRAKRHREIRCGLRNSSNRIVPGWMGLRFASMLVCFFSVTCSSLQNKALTLPSPGVPGEGKSGRSHCGTWRPGFRRVTFTFSLGISLPLLMRSSGSKACLTLRN